MSTFLWNFFNLIIILNFCFIIRLIHQSLNIVCPEELKTKSRGNDGGGKAPMNKYSVVHSDYNKRTIYGRVKASLNIVYVNLSAQE